MIKKYIIHDDYDRRSILQDAYILRYYSKKRMKKKYRQKHYTIIGALGNEKAVKIGTIAINNHIEDIHSLCYSKFNYGIDGYLDCGNHEVIAIVKNKRKRNSILLLVSIVVFTIGLYLAMQNNKQDKIPIDTNITDYSPDIQISDNVDGNSIAIPSYDEIMMTSNTNEMYVALWNPKSNPCYFKFKLVLENGEMLYASDLVPPGKAITKIHLKQNLTEGIYPIQIIMETYALEDGSTPLNSGTSKSIIHVVNP